MRELDAGGGGDMEEVDVPPILVELVVCGWRGRASMILYPVWWERDSRTFPVEGTKRALR